MHSAPEDSGDERRHIAAFRRVVELDVSGLPAAAGTVDVLARLQLALARQRWRVRVVGAGPDLHGLIELMGLAEVLLR